MEWEVWSGKEAVRSEKFEVWSAKSAVCSVRCGVSREGHGRDRVSLNYRSFMFGKLPPPACPGLCYEASKSSRILQVLILAPFFGLLQSMLSISTPSDCVFFTNGSCSVADIIVIAVGNLDRSGQRSYSGQWGAMICKKVHRLV